MSRLPEHGTLMVAIANQETADRLIGSAIAIAREHSMDIRLLHVIEVPPQIPLSEGKVLLDEESGQQAMLADAQDRCLQADVQADSRIRYARDVATGIVGAVSEHDVDGLVMGWRGRPRRTDIVLGSFLDRVLGEAQCDVFVKRIRRPPRDVDSILVPVVGGPHCDLSVTLASGLTNQYNASVSIVHVLPETATEDATRESEAMLSEYVHQVEHLDIPVNARIIQSDHVPGAVTDETAHHNLTILGTTREPFLNRKLVGSVAEGVARASASQLMLTRAFNAEC